MVIGRGSKGPHGRFPGMRIGFLLFGLLAVALGGLWLVQGLGLLVIPPILCVAACEPVVGPSLTWTIAGAVALLTGALLLARARQ